MTTIKYRSYMAPGENVPRNWRLIDAQGKVLGRLATEIATILRGKHKPTYTPHIDTGDYVIVINAAKIKVTGDRLTQKYYYRHSMYPGALKSVQLQKLLKEKPTRPIEYAVRGMLPDNRLGDKMFKKLRVYPGASHPYEKHLAALARKAEAAASPAPAQSE
ncbi:MAG: 50S ribosomal protein L13 [Dehalococcoidia bacterium]|nr:50S ribosomal protein L13 [Dehalococcoidia bacterium]